jgi:hypothetical protein
MRRHENSLLRQLGHRKPRVNPEVIYPGDRLIVIRAEYRK